jgi:hypothetical protein
VKSLDPRECRRVLLLYRLQIRDDLRDVGVADLDAGIGGMSHSGRRIQFGA